jgi:hypothetical protein
MTGPFVTAVNAGFYQVVNCPPGKKVVGGGYQTNAGGQVTWSSSAPSGSGAWMVSGRTTAGTPVNATFFTIRINAS